MNALNGYKTYIVAIVTIVYALVAFWNGSLDQNAAVAMILAALGASGLRHGISTSAKP